MSQLDLYIEEAKKNEERKTSELQLIAELNQITGSSDVNQTLEEEEMKRVETKAVESLNGGFGPALPSAVPMFDERCRRAGSASRRGTSLFLSGSDATNWLLLLIAFLLFMILCNMKGE